MDRRHTEIVEGAGLEESRINADFADWLKRWGSPILLIILVMALGYRGWMWYQQKETAALDSAFIDLDAASQAGQPLVLLQVANDWDGRATVSHQARLEAADRFMLAYASNVKPGGAPGVAEDIPTEEERRDYLAQAERLYQQVEQGTGSDSMKALLHIHALSGLAAVAATRSEFDKAVGHLERVIAIATEQDLQGLAAAMVARLETIRNSPNPAPLPSQDSIVVTRTPEPAAPAEGEFLTPDELLNELGPSPAPAEGAETTPAEPPAEGEGAGETSAEGETPAGGG